METNNFLPISNASNEMFSEELNEIILHTVPNVWKKQSYLQGWDFNVKNCKEICAMFKHM